MKNQTVSSFIEKNEISKKVDLQDEIYFEDNSYRAPDINFLSKPEMSKESIVDQEELNLNAEQLKSVLTDFKIEGEII